jgi:hypothetical protein
MTDPISLEPLLHELSALPEERRAGSRRDRRDPTDGATSDEQRLEAFTAHVHDGGKIEPNDWMPDEYRTAVLRFVEMHANS